MAAFSQTVCINCIIQAESDNWFCILDIQGIWLSPCNDISLPMLTTLLALGLKMLGNGLLFMLELLNLKYFASSESRLKESEKMINGESPDVTAPLFKGLYSSQLRSNLSFLIIIFARKLNSNHSVYKKFTSLLQIVMYCNSNVAPLDSVE